jgi:hypothetical protein
MTVGAGISPTQFQFILEVAGCNRRYGISPLPEDKLKCNERNATAQDKADSIRCIERKERTPAMLTPALYR